MANTRISRREFLQLSAGATAGAAIAGSAMGTFLFTEEAQAVSSAVSLTPFLDELPIPPALTGATQRLTLRQTTHRFHQSLSAVPVWGYNGGTKTGGYLGPTIVAQRGTPTTVSYVNRLPTKHLLNVDPTIVQMKGRSNVPRILTHLHGGHISASADGNPYANADFAPGTTQRVRYANDQEAALIWYHDHALGITRLNVMAGLAGAYLVRDSIDNGTGGNFTAFGGGTLPSGDYEVPLVIQDRAFAKDGRIKYPAQWTPEFFGDVVCVNGKVWPFKNVEPRKYRMRILNGSNSRFYNLQLTGGATMTQIGTDGGFLLAPVPIPKLLIAPGERADVVFDFTGTSGNVHLIDTALPTTTVSPATPLQRSEIVRFVVGATVSVPDGPLPTQLRTRAYSVPGAVARERFLTLEEMMAGINPTMLMLNGMDFATMPVTERPRRGETEIWTFVNLSADTHPMHVHLPQFEVLERRQLDVAGYQAALTAARNAAGGPVDASGQLVNPNPGPFLGAAQELVDANEKGPKDTVRANPNQITRVRVNFDIRGKYVWHCHILEHEENDMMRPLDVV
jgi:spore coat protein A